LDPVALRRFPEPRASPPRSSLCRPPTPYPSRGGCTIPPTATAPLPGPAHVRRMPPPRSGGRLPPVPAGTAPPRGSPSPLYHCAFLDGPCLFSIVRRPALTVEEPHNPASAYIAASHAMRASGPDPALARRRAGPTRNPYHAPPSLHHHHLPQHRRFDRRESPSARRVSAPPHALLSHNTPTSPAGPRIAAEDWSTTEALTPLHGTSSPAPA